MSTAQPRLKRERKRSREIFERAEKVLVGGVNSPVRAFRSVGGEPLIIERGSGQCLYDADGNELLDFVCSWGAMILGHANPAISEAIAEQARRGTSFGVTTELELELATLITRAIPFIEKIRFVSSGTEATMSAVERLFSLHKDKIAAVIVEPIAANMGVVPPETGFLKGLHEICKKNGTLLIVDEVITGFRLRNGSVQENSDIEADLTTLGKIIGGGVPVAAYGGPAELMDQVAPLGPVYQAGTLAGNPLAMSAGIAALKQLTKPGLYEETTQLAQRLVLGLRAELADAGIPARINAFGSLATVFFTSEPVRNYSDAKRSNTKRYAKCFREMLDRGIFLAPSQFEAAFVSMAHTSQDIDRTLAAAHESLQVISADSAA